MTVEVDFRFLSDLIDRLTDPRNLESEQAAFRKLKQTCKTVERPAIKHSFELLIEKLKDSSSDVRLKAVNLIEELFRRSSAFRAMTAQFFALFLELSVGHKASRPLPPPELDAAKLRKRALEVVEGWVEQYGNLYPQISLGYQYLKNVLKLQFPELQARAAAREAEAVAREERSLQIYKDKYSNVKQEYISRVADINETLSEMAELFQILEGNSQSLNDERDENEWEDVEPQLEDGIAGYQDSFSKTLFSIPSSMNNSPAVIESLEEKVKLIANRHLPTLSEWLKILVKVDCGEPGSTEQTRRDQILRELIKVRDRSAQAKMHWESIMSNEKFCSISGGTACEDVLMITAKTTDASNSVKVTASTVQAGGSTSRERHKAAKELLSQSNAPSQVLEDVFGLDSNEQIAPRPVESKEAHQQRDSQVITARQRQSQDDAQPFMFADPARKPVHKHQSPSQDIVQSGPKANIKTKAGSVPEAVKQKLLAAAPSIPGGTHLAYWDSDSASLLNNKGMEVYNHWGAVDENVQLPDHVISTFFSTRATYYTPDTKNKRKAEEDPRKNAEPAESVEPPAFKRVARVTAIGGVPSNSSSLDFKPLSFCPPLGSSLHAPPPQSATNTHSQLSRPGHISHITQVGLSSQAKAGTEQQGSVPTVSGEGDCHGQSRASAKDGRDDNDSSLNQRHREPPTEVHNKATQRALDRAHNEAILQSAGKTDEEIANTLAEHELQVLRGCSVNGKKKIQEKAPVRDRLAKKLLGGKATLRAIEDLDTVENENFMETESRRW